MTIRLGVIGETPSIKIFAEIINSYKDFQLLVFSNDREDQHFTIVEKYNRQVDAWLFLEQGTYVKVKLWQGTSKPLYYLHYRSANMYKVFTRMLMEGHPIERLSFDTVYAEDLDVAFGETGILQKEIYSLSDKEGRLELEDYLNFHRSLYHQGKIDRAITCSYYIKTLLEQEGIPVECVLPLRVTIRHILNTIINEFRLLEMQDQQLAVQILTFKNFYDKRNFRSADDIYSKKLQLTQKLLNYAKQVNGSLKVAEGGDYYIFATRGSFSRLTKGLTTKPEGLLQKELEHNLLACGIGMGSSAREAEVNALEALGKAYEHGEGSWFVMLDEESILGPLAEDKPVVEEELSKTLQRMSQHTGININSLYNIWLLKERKGSQHLNAAEVADALQLQPRSARRLLAILEEKEYATVSCVSRHEHRGRPVKLYKIKM